MQELRRRHRINLIVVVSWIAVEGAVPSYEHQVSIIGNHDEFGIREKGLEPIEVLERVPPDLALALCVEVRVCGVLLENPKKGIRVGAKLFGKLIEYCHEVRAESPNGSELCGVPEPPRGVPWMPNCSAPARPLQ